MTKILLQISNMMKIPLSTIKMMKLPTKNSKIITTHLKTFRIIPIFKIKKFIQKQLSDVILEVSNFYNYTCECVCV